MALLGSRCFRPYPGNNVDIRMLTGRRRTLATFNNGEQVIIDDTWDRPTARGRVRGVRRWRGRTEFEVTVDAAEFVNDRIVFLPEVRKSRIGRLDLAKPIWHLDAGS
jgi:hypothetical protein